MNLIDLPTDFAVNGWTLTKPERNLLAKLQKEYGFDVTNTGPVTMATRISGFRLDNVNPLVAELVLFVYEAYSTYEANGFKMSYLGKRVPIGLFDRVKYLVLRLDPHAYSGLID